MVNVAVEGESDRGVASAVVRAAGRSVGLIRVAGGKSRLDPLIPKYNLAAVQHPWVVFRDSDAACPVSLRQELTATIAAPNEAFCLRIAHSMSEAWLLSDTDAFAHYFAVPRGRVPADPEAFPHAKRTLLSLCSESRSRAIRSEVVSVAGGAGPLFVAHMNAFAGERWNARDAAERSQSLRRAIAAIRALPGPA
ncbi:hypothetical protein [Rathayibacter sp. VKM Ac-2926]|uniref:hypothetical protein n=1 Tax=Rathayibacter sp. VKM Ac-2926 TaxID=2929477 RepID=UPI001FB1FCBC|nr:hypothetical protein [Rathayibacter sp. VKM Ac-2926]MCJ1704652.1 hypothetical protein [Rathayibacter sp. VKM Ac-2926]